MKDHWQRAGAHAGLQSPQSHLEVWVVYRLETAGSLSRGRARSSSIWIASRRFGVFDRGTDWTWQQAKLGQGAVPTGTAQHRAGHLAVPIHPNLIRSLLSARCGSMAAARLRRTFRYAGDSDDDNEGRQELDEEGIRPSLLLTRRSPRGVHLLGSSRSRTDAL